MQVKLYASSRQSSGIRMVDVDVQPGATIREVLVEVTLRTPPNSVSFGLPVSSRLSLE